ncbi:MAG TPA: hypothetical protein VEK15_06750 [Vicinamibacteria bacterium]|nr:hypothetical protein [Vicinamibacteria bacterium]
MNRRDFFKLSVAGGAGTLFSSGNAPGAPFVECGAGVVQGAMRLPENPGFKTKHLVVIILGNGARKIDVIDNPEHSPFQSRMARDGTLFREDYGESANLHGYMYTEMLTGRDDPAQRPRFPTWNEYVRKKTGGKASEFWILQGASYYRAWTWDVKNFSKHPDYGVRYGATNLTMNRFFDPAKKLSTPPSVDLHFEKGLGHSKKELGQITEWLAEVKASKRYEPPSTRRPLIDRLHPIGDCQAIQLAGEILRAFKPRIITVQVLALDDAHSELGDRAHDTHFEEYINHIETTDELIGNLWREIQDDPYLRGTTSLVIRPECGRNDDVDEFGQLGHSPGSYAAHTVWTCALGPDFRRNHVVTERVQRRDVAPTITYLMSGASAEYATGHVRTQLFRDKFRMPAYVLPPTAELRQLGVN